MQEQKIIKKQLLKSMLYNFIAFSIIFTIFGAVIFNSLRIELYKSADAELEASIERYKDSVKPKGNIGNKEFKGENFGEGFGENFGGNNKNRMNPRIVEIIRDENGNIVNEDSIGRFYDEFSKSVEFSMADVGVIYETKIDSYNYRGINIKITNEEGETEYVQLLLNVDAEKNTIDNYFKILAWGIVTTVCLSILASYILSKHALKPVVASWEKQTEFVQNASHELRTPLTIIQTKQELLLQEPDSKIIDKSEDIRLTLNEAKRLTKLTKDLMVLARADSNNVTLNKEEIEIDNFIKEVAMPYQEFAEAQGKQIILNLNYNKTINVDRNQIHQLMVILLDNSMKYTEKDETITIETQAKERKCIIEVKDTGIGVNDGTIKHAFERFYREDKARSRKAGGSGLGLSIAHYIVDSHGGTIKMDHNEPKGTIVTIKLPK